MESHTIRRTGVRNILCSRCSWEHRILQLRHRKPNPNPCMKEVWEVVMSQKSHEKLVARAKQKNLNSLRQFLQKIEKLDAIGWWQMAEMLCDPFTVLLRLYLSPSAVYTCSQRIIDITTENSRTRYNLSTMLTQKQRPSGVLETATIKMDSVETAWIPASFSFCQ